jgi:hypothetical protein
MNLTLWEEFHFVYLLLSDMAVAPSGLRIVCIIYTVCRIFQMQLFYEYSVSCLPGYTVFFGRRRIRSRAKFAAEYLQYSTVVQ